MAVVALLVAVGLTTYGMSVRARDETYPGTSAPGSHQFYSLGDPETDFCNACHSAIRTELTNSASGHEHQGNQCLRCHAPSADGHAASPALCADCHYGGGGGGDGDCHTCHGPGQPYEFGCLVCHGPHGGGDPPQGHGGDQATELASDAHAGFYISIGETPETASWVCKACHTKVDTPLTVTANAPLPLHLGPTYP